VVAAALRFMSNILGFAIEIDFNVGVQVIT
jgi:hypothetical protein